jgi:8-oxo-dGTP pyrophosphatase MutT (NUDIX family)
MDNHLRHIFSSRQKKRLPIENLKVAAVLVPLFNDGKEYRILLTRRSNQVLYHKGQISFPGGKPHKNDSSLQETALRESKEEIGLAREDVEIIGELDDTETITSGFLISPFVALIPYPYKFVKNPRETTEILDIPLSALMEDSNCKQKLVNNSGTLTTICTFTYKNNKIWGATARIIKQLVDTLKSSNGAQP